MFLILGFFALLLSLSYIAAKAMTGAMGLFTFSISTSTFFLWRYLSYSPIVEPINIFEHLYNVVSQINLPAAIVTGLVALLSGTYFCISRRVMVNA